MKKPGGGAAPPRTQFEQVPVEIVKKIVDKNAPKAKKSTNVVAPRIVRDEV